MVLITGSNSLLGTALVKKFIANGEEVRCFDSYKPGEIPEGADFIQGDLFNFKRLNKACKGADTVIHLMDKNRSTKVGRAKMKKMNIKGTQNLLYAVKKAKIKKVIFLSTYAVYGKTKSFPIKEDDKMKPCTPYGKDKLKAEILSQTYAKKNGINLTIIRPALITGPEVKNPSILITLYMAMGMGNDNVAYMSGNGDTRFQLLSIEDATDAFYKVYKSGAKTSGMIFNAGSDNVLTQMEQIIKLKEKKKLDFAIKHINPLKAFLYSILFRPSKVNYFTKEHRFFIFNSLYLDCQKIKTSTGWSPKKDNIAILSETVDWYENKVSKS